MNEDAEGDARSTMTSSDPPCDVRDIVLYQSEWTEVWRRQSCDSAGSIIIKRPLREGAEERLRHERRILERIATVDGVPRLSTLPVLPDALVFVDTGGIPLSQVIRGERMDVAFIVELALELTQTVAAIHHLGVVHRDINPANILLSGTGRRPTLIDFDLATTSAEELPSFTHQSDIVGTLPYIAPEQTGRTGHSVDQRADLYALGATLYQLLTGRPPFTSNDPLDLIRDHLARLPSAPVDLVPHVPIVLSDVVLRLLAKEPDKRYQSASGLAHDLSRLRSSKKYENRFPLGEGDFPMRLMAPSRLCGREDELRALQLAFNTALDSRHRGVLIAGTAGVGKSALINALRPLVTEKGGWFVLGKFDQYQANGSSATIQALRGLGRMLLAEPDDELAEYRRQIVSALGNNAGAITAILPEFATLLGEQPAASSAEPADTDTQLQIATLDLLRTIVSSKRPLVLVLDDLQWADSASIRFFDGVLCDDALRGLLIVGTYRGEEVDATHHLAAMRPRWEKLNVEPLLLQLQNLPPAELTELLSEMLRLPSSSATAMAEAVSGLTGGNPFDTVALINALRHDRILTLGKQGWIWDGAAIERYVGPKSIIDTLSVRISRLPRPTQEMLEILACLGGEISFDLLQIASNLPVALLDEQLVPALEDGLLVQEMVSLRRGGRDGTLRFRHDRVQQAVRERLDAARSDALQIALARRLAPIPALAHEAAMLYLAVMPQLQAPEECRRVIDLFRAAASGARRITAHSMTERYLEAALTLLDRLETEMQSPLRLRLEQDRHATLIHLGRLEEADEVYSWIEVHCEDEVALVDSAAIQISSLTSRSGEPKALSLGFALLCRLGVEIPADNFAFILPVRLEEFFQWAATLDLDMDLRRPEVRDRRIVAIAKLIHQLSNTAAFIDQSMMTWLVLESQRLWTEHGPCPTLIYGLAVVCPVTISTRSDYRTGYEIVRHVLAVAEARGYETEACQARFALAVSGTPWFEPLNRCVAEAHRAREGLIRNGNTQIASYAHYPAIVALLDCGPTLIESANEIDSSIAFAVRTGDERGNDIYLAHRQLLRALLGKTGAPGSFDEETFDESSHLSSIRANPLGLVTYHIYRSLCGAIFGDFSCLAQHIDAAMPLLPVVQSYYPAALAYLLKGFSLTQRIKTAQSSDCTDLLSEFNKCRKWISARAADAPFNFLHLLRWLDAEQAWAVGDRWGAMRAFETAICAGRSSGRPWHKAIMVERAGLFYIADGLERIGRELLAEARHLYDAWGAIAKVQQLERIHELPSMVIHTTERASRGRSSGVSADALDLLAILRASQALSSETTLASLSCRVAELIGAMTGATKVTLVLWDVDKKGWQLWPHVSGESEPNTIEEASVHKRLPMSTFRYVERTHQPLLLADAKQDDRFFKDPYFSNLEHCSLLLVPILNKGTMQAILVLENSLTDSAFSTSRLDAVVLIAGQLAVSLENVLLYRSLERKVAERTADLEEANRRLAAMAITDPLTGLANRRHFAQVLETEWLRALRGRTSLGAVMVDIDQFKLYNDHYGHQGGDNCIRLVAATLGDRFRLGIDVVARYGGEEFAIILPGADYTATYQAAERARVAVAALQEPHVRALHGIVTISVGIAAAVPSHPSGAEQLFSFADSALYEAKQLGRNRVEGKRDVT